MSQLAFFTTESTEAHSTLETSTLTRESSHLIEDSSLKKVDSNQTKELQHEELEVYMNIDGLTFRPMFIGDVPQVKELHDELFPVKYSERFYASLVEKPYCAVLVLDSSTNILVGVATGRVQVGDEEQVEGYIATFGVHPNFRRKGLGRTLLSLIIDVLKAEAKCDVDVELHVKSDNQPAIQLYVSEGFKVMETLKDHYFFDERHHDALRLCLGTDQPKTEVKNRQNCTIL